MVAPEPFAFAATGRNALYPDSILRYIAGLIGDDVASVGADHRTVSKNLFQLIYYYLTAAATAVPQISKEAPDGWRRFGRRIINSSTLAALPSFGIITVTEVPAEGEDIAIDHGAATRTYTATTGGDVQFTPGATVVTTAAALAAAINGDSSRGVQAVNLLNSTTLPKIAVLSIAAGANNDAMVVTGGWGTVIGLTGGKAAS